MRIIDVTGEAELRAAIELDTGQRTVRLVGLIRTADWIVVRGASGCGLTITGVDDQACGLRGWGGITVDGGVKDLAIRGLSLYAHEMLDLPVADGVLNRQGAHWQLTRKGLLFYENRNHDPIRNALVENCSFRGLDGCLGIASGESLTVRRCVIGPSSRYGDQIPPGCFDGDLTWEHGGQQHQGFSVGGDLGIVAVEENLIYNCGCRIPLVYHDSGELRLLGNVIGGSWYGVSIEKMGGQLLLAGNEFRQPDSGKDLRELVLIDGGSAPPGSIALVDNLSRWRSGWHQTGYHRWPGYPDPPTAGFSNKPWVNGPLSDLLRWESPMATYEGDAWGKVNAFAGSGIAWDSLLKRQALTRAARDWELEPPPHWDGAGKLVKP